MTCSLDRHPVGPDWPIIWTRPLDSLELSWLHGGRQMQSWRLCGLRLHEFGTWCWAAPMGCLLWQHLCPWQRGCSKAGLMLQLLTGSVGGPILRLLPPCRISQS
jgi:hypothetical protein